MNTSAIIMLVLVLGIFLGGIGFCMSRLGKRRDDSDPVA